jgi:hypothetical protein
MRTIGAITNPSGYPYQWVCQTDYVSRDEDTERFTTLGNPFTMRVVSGREAYELVQLLASAYQRGMQTLDISYPYNFSNRETYQRRIGQRAPYGL